jgi:hypothetical protein
MQHRKTVTQSASGNQAINSGAHGVTRAARRSVELNSLVEDFCPEWGFNDGHYP